MLARIRVALERVRARYPLADASMRVFVRYGEDDAGTLTASLTYYVFFSIFPLYFFTASLLGYLTFINESIRQEFVSRGLSAFPFLTAFTFLTTKQQSFTDVVPGAVLASIVFEVLKVVGAWYLSRTAASRSEAFGGFAKAAGLLVGPTFCVR
jgi:uncharacterized BrkB/YihY/UPF0761 family membrane protein